MRALERATFKNSRVFGPDLPRGANLGPQSSPSAQQNTQRVHKHTGDCDQSRSRATIAIRDRVRERVATSVSSGGRVRDRESSVPLGTFP